MKTDFVIAWVDGNDLEWRKEKEKYSPSKIDESNSDNRYRDWGLLPYWFRGVEKFTPWVNKIFFVTWGHVPEFLNIDNEKLEIVSHKSFIPKKYLPTFSSHAIEVNLHRIPKLSEHFVYFNDDMFIIRPMPETSFFRSDLPCTCGSERPIELAGDIGIWQHAAVNDLGIINKNFCKSTQVEKYQKKYASSEYRWQDNIRTKVIERLYPDYFTGFKNLHAPAAYLKSTFESVWNAETDLLDKTSSNRFRTAEDVNQWVMLWWQIASGNFSPFSVDNVVSGITDDTVEDLSKIISSQNHDMICLNDPDGDIDFNALSDRIKSAFDAILPDKSSFEK